MFGLEFYLEDCPESFLARLPRGERIPEGSDVYFAPFKMKEGIGFQVEIPYSAAASSGDRRYVSVISMETFREIVQVNDPHIHVRPDTSVSEPSEMAQQKEKPHPPHCRCTLCGEGRVGN